MEENTATAVPSSTSINEPEAQKVVEAEKETTTPKKRKETQRRAACWEHFEPIYEVGVHVRGRCKYYASVLHAHFKINGTSSLRNHLLYCTKHPGSKESRQALLTLKPKSNVEANDSGSIGIIGCWKFDQEAIRNALALMCITDELPFKCVEREGFSEINDCRLSKV